jgi:hypothetical protein
MHPMRDESGRPGVHGAGDERPSCEPDEVIVEVEPATRELLDKTTEATWNEALRQLGNTPSNPLPLWTTLASRILSAVATGERDPERLQRLALEGLRNRDWFAEDAEAQTNQKGPAPPVERGQP